MIAILNYLHIIVLVITALLIYRFRASGKKMLWTGVAGAVILLALQAFTPSYMPKGAPHRQTLAPMEPSTAVVEDRLSKPDTLEERDARLNDELDWREQIEEEKAKQADQPENEE